MNKIICFSLPISWILFVIFQRWEYSSFLLGILGGNIGISISVLWKNDYLKDIFMSHLKYKKGYETTLLHLDNDTILCQFKKCEKEIS